MLLENTNKKKKEPTVLEPERRTSIAGNDSVVLYTNILPNGEIVGWNGGS